MRNIIYRLLKRLLTIGMVLQVATTAAGAGTPVSLSFLDTVAINDTVIRLGDIAKISAASDSIARLFGAVTVGNAAPPGYCRFVNSGDLLSYRLAPAFKDVEFRADRQKRIKVRTVCIEKKVGEYVPLIQEYVRSRSAWKEGRVSVDVETPEMSWKCFDAPVTVTVQGLDNMYPKGHLQLQLVAGQYGRVVRIPVSCRISVIVPVLATKSAVPRGKIFGLDDIEKREVDISNFGPTPCFEAMEVVGRRAQRSLSAGSILHDRLFAEVPVVAKGDAVSVVKTNGDVKISVAAVARENGYLGQKIWVENAMTHKLFRVTVKNKSVCMVM
jgi:flagella basal body P-ring formation protein FlgA